jgi:hypothetical protein
MFVCDFLWYSGCLQNENDHHDNPNPISHMRFFIAVIDESPGVGIKKYDLTLF